MNYSDTTDLLVNGKDIVGEISASPGSVTAIPKEFSLVRRATLDHIYEHEAAEASKTPGEVSLIDDLGFVDKLPK